MNLARPHGVDRLKDGLELAGILLLLGLVFVSVPLTLGRLGLSWDSINHHIYLGWEAQTYRLNQDYLAAASQSSQFPYLYWPVAMLAIGNASGVTAGVVLALLHVAAVPPVWWVARLLLPQQDLAGVTLRVIAVVLGFMSAVPLKTLESTGNDFLAAIPILWAIAMCLHAIKRTPDHEPWRWALGAGLVAGVGIAFKMSNGPLAILLPLMFMFARGSVATRARLALACAAGLPLGFMLTYGYWGWQMWNVYGNPVYPFADGLFSQLRAATGWTP